MNVALVVHHYDLSEGTGGYTVELLTRIARHHQVTLYATGVRAPIPDGVRVIKVPALTGRAYATILSFPAAFAAVRRRRAHDIVHAQGWVTGSANVVTAHIILRAWRAAARQAGIRSPRGERTFGSFVERREQRLYRSASAVIAPSAKAKSELAHCYGREHHVTIVPHGFPTGRPIPSRTDARRRFSLPPDAFVALYVGDPRKGLRTAVEAIAAARGVYLAVVSRSAREPYDPLIRASGVSERVLWIGGLTDPGPVYAAADVLVHPTIYDSFGLVVAEAMACGTPAIVTTRAGISELLTHGVSGWLVEPSELVAGVTAGLQALMGDSALRQKLSEGARVRAGGRTWDDVALETLAVYERVVG